MTEQFYNLSHESSIEKIFASHISGYLDASIDFQRQVEVETCCGRFSIDFVAESNSKKIGFECDGRWNHNGRKGWRDEWRDAIILGEEKVDAIYKLRGTDLTHHPEDCLLIIARWDPEIFSESGLIKLEGVASEEARLYSPFSRGGNAEAEIKYRGVSGAGSRIIVERRSYEASADRVAFWKHLFEYAKSNSSNNLNEIMRDYEKEAELWNG